MTTARDPIDARDEAAAEWCLRLTEGPLSAQEQVSFDAWLDAADNAERFERALAVWHGVELAAETPELICVRGEALEQFRAANSRRWQTPGAANRWMPRVAAVFIFALIAGLVLLASRDEVYETQTGERQIAMLEDGSRVSLDAATRVEVHFTKGRRQLTLVQGRAKFDVAKNPLRPFSVAVGNTMVVATGTSFSVELLRQKVHVVLYEGRVAVLDHVEGRQARGSVSLSTRAAPADQILLPGRELVASLDAPVATVSEVDLPQSLSWETGQLSFEGEPLTSAIERLNRYSPTRLRIADDATGRIRVDGVFTAGDTNAFLEALPALYPVTIEHHSGEIVLRQKRL